MGDAIEIRAGRRHARRAKTRVLRIPLSLGAVSNHEPESRASRVPRDTKMFQPHVEARKAFGVFSNAQLASWESISMLPVCHLRGRELCEAFSCDRRTADKFSCRPKGVFVTDATTQPRGTGLPRTTMTANDAEGIKFGGSGELGNRATRDVVAFGSWLKTADAVRYRPCG